MITQVRAQRPDMPVIMAGNKADQAGRRVFEAEGAALAEELDVFFTETSAKTGEGVERLENLALDIVWDPSFDPLGSRLPHLVLTLSAYYDTSGQVPVTCTTLSGTVLASLQLTQLVTLGCLHLMLVELFEMPRTRLKMALPSGELGSCKHCISDAVAFIDMPAAA